MSFGADVLWERLESLTKRGVVDRWKFPQYNRYDLMTWLMGQWELRLGYKPVISKLEKGWYCFHLLKEEDVSKVMANSWVNGRSFLTLHKWDCAFHLSRNAPVNHLLWVKLVGLPLHF